MHGRQSSFTKRRPRNLLELPWYQGDGNHDMGKTDPCCVCAKLYCPTHNATYLPWCMPSFTYRVPMPEVNTEIIGLDTNFDWQGDCGDAVLCWYDVLNGMAYAGARCVV